MPVLPKRSASLVLAASKTRKEFPPPLFCLVNEVYGHLVYFAVNTYRHVRYSMMQAYSGQAAIAAVFLDDYFRA